MTALLAQLRRLFAGTDHWTRDVWPYARAAIAEHRRHVAIERAARRVVAAYGRYWKAMGVDETRESIAFDDVRDRVADLGHVIARRS